MLAALNFMTLILSRLIRQMLVNFFGVDSKGLYQSSGKEKQSCCLAFPSSTKREFRHFHVVVVQRRLRNVQRKPIAFLPSSLPSPSSLLELLNKRFRVTFVVWCKPRDQVFPIIVIYYLLLTDK